MGGQEEGTDGMFITEIFRETQTISGTQQLGTTLEVIVVDVPLILG